VEEEWFQTSCKTSSQDVKEVIIDEYSKTSPGYSQRA
jgi:hypothetical protein